MIKICRACGREFETNNPQKIYCNGEHYLPCPICGKLVLKRDNDFSRPAKCCSSECSHKLRQSNIKKRRCIFCGEAFSPSSGSQIACSKTHYDKCEICGKEFIRTVANYNDGVTTCSPECTKEKMRRNSLEKYGTEHPMQNKEVQDNFKRSMKEKYGVEHALQIASISHKQQESAFKTNMENHGVPYACMLPQCIEAQGKIISEMNRQFASKLKEHGIQYSYEKRINDMSYDICIENSKTLIEIDPSYTHNSFGNHWGQPRDKYYHRDKSQNAADIGYRCIHVFDWDDWSNILDLVSPKQFKLYARNCQIWKIHNSVADEFLNKNHLQGTCRGQLLCLGLAVNNELLQLMTFGKSRYDKSHDIELLRLCTKKGFSVIGGASKLFHYATEMYGLHNIVSYCDRSKFTGTVYEKMGMKLLRITPPQEIWSKGSQKITANLLRQRGYDQLFGTSYGKGTSNYELMLKTGWLPVYDCGQYVYEFK